MLTATANSTATRVSFAAARAPAHRLRATPSTLRAPAASRRPLRQRVEAKGGGDKGVDPVQRRKERRQAQEVSGFVHDPLLGWVGVGCLTDWGLRLLRSGCATTWRGSWAYRRGWWKRWR